MSENQICDALLEEYRSLRAESLNAILHRNQITGLSFTALSLMISAASIAKLPNLVAVAVLIVLIPFIAKLVSLTWLGEYERSKRAGAAIEAIEKKVNDFLDHNALTWEYDLSKKGISMTYPYIAALGIMLGAGYVSISISSVFLLRYFADDLGLVYPLRACLLALVVPVLVELAFLGILRSMWRSARSRYLNMFSAMQPGRVAFSGNSIRVAADADSATSKAI